jgi:hypothetical protein
MTNAFAAEPPVTKYALHEGWGKPIEKMFSAIFEKGRN